MTTWITALWEVPGLFLTSMQSTLEVTTGRGSPKYEVMFPKSNYGPTKLLRSPLNVRDAGSRGQRGLAPPPPQYVHMSDCGYALGHSVRACRKVWGSPSEKVAVMLPGRKLTRYITRRNAPKEFAINYTFVVMISASARRYTLKLHAGGHKTGNSAITACRSLQAAITFAGWNSAKRVNSVKAAMTGERDIITSCFCDGIKWAWELSTWKCFECILDFFFCFSARDNVWQYFRLFGVGFPAINYLTRLRKFKSYGL